MRANEQASLLSEGHAHLRRLFEIAERRLHDRGIRIQTSPSVLEWLMDQSDWRLSLNPLRTLDGYWHQQVASVIEGLLLDGSLRLGNVLSVSLMETSTGSQIQFDISPSM